MEHNARWPLEGIAWDDLGRDAGRGERYELVVM